MYYTIIEYKQKQGIFYINKTHYDLDTTHVINFLKKIPKRADSICVLAGVADEILYIDFINKKWTRGYTSCSKRLHDFILTMQDEVKKGGFEIVEHY